jgi:regulator of nucleoside diphosphate kinase
VNEGPPETRVIVQRDEAFFPGSLLPITSLRGIALLGLQEGQSITVRRPGGLEETIRVEHVEYQPEAAMRLARKNASRADCIVSLAERREMRSSVVLPGDDDPGPTAA